ncbi:hypothetical protein E4N62_19600 [Streptomyces sp. MNU76]|uniref:hypothetical protein n=1 Tax=Streptomyces sp. MNU76 TaxID=2560026 RepID=UPI001E31AD8A|nr:hypothetical protein [Streptomyces sp. MNU76]MCC9707285.1 hypothetical protein [Streptomyces sp. MNU76]
MPATTAELTARKRPRRTRTRTVSTRPAIKISELPLQHVDLRPDFVSLVCPECETWCPVTAAQSRTPKLVPHHSDPADEGEAARCGSSNRRVDLDVPVAEWAKRLTDGIADTKSRRTNRVVRKPKTRVVPAVIQILEPILDAKGALKLYRNHRDSCAICQQSGYTRCVDGGRLAHLYVHKQRTEPSRRKALAFQEELARMEEEREERGLPLLREWQWGVAESTVRRADIQRAYDSLKATLLHYGPHLDRFERADLSSVITTLAEKLRRL